MCVCVWGANIAFGLFHTSYSNLFSLWLKWLQDVVLCGFNIHWAIQWPLLVPRGLKKKSLQKRPLPSRWTWSLIMVFSGICFIPWRFDGHKIPPPAFKDCQRMGCVPCKGIYDFFLKQISGKKSNGNVKRSWGRLNPWYWRCKLCALL